MDKVIVIAGGNGFLGRYLAAHMIGLGWQVRVITRHSEGIPEGAEYHYWDGINPGAWSQALEGANVLVNMAGRTVNCRYHEEHKNQIIDSRVQTTQALGRALNGLKSPPQLWVNSSTATIYRHAEDCAQTDQNGELGTGFSVEVAKRWEKSFDEAQVPKSVRKVATRTAIVLADEPGTVVAVLRRIARMGLGGKMGTGKQMVSWIHIEDFCRAIVWFIEQNEQQGTFNLSAPNPVTNASFMKSMRDWVRVPIGLPATKWMLELGAFILRTETELILKSRWVLPTRLQEQGFKFTYPTIEKAFQQFKSQS